MEFLIPTTLSELYKNMKSSVNYNLYFDDINYIRSVSTLPGQEHVPPTGIYPGLIAELNTIKRNEKYFDIGSEIKVNELLKNGQNILPHIFINALANTGLPNSRNIYTIGGMVCDPKIRNKIYSALALLNAKIEVSSSMTAGSKKTMLVSKLYQNGRLQLQNGEMVLNFKIPYTTYDVDYYKEIQDTNHNICFMGIASTFRKNITMCRFVIGNWGDSIIREQEFETAFMEQKIPVPQKDIEAWSQQFGEIFNRKYTSFSPYLQKTLRNIFEDFISQL
ncbi:MAG: FAD binding domain-containing protein [Spirochaetia bacterium]|nr:FAD binding domain-containing protein [Spirochaetia bacterium]